MAVSLQQRLITVIRIFAQARLFAWVLLWLMVVLLMGTVAEKTDGLYAAQQRYFSSYIIWLNGWLPVPGLLSTSIVIFIGLMARLALETWRWKHLGTIVIHIGAAVLLVGGFITSHIASEGIMIIPQGETRDYMDDLRHVTVVVSELSNKTIKRDVIVPDTQAAGQTIIQTDLPFTIEPVLWCRNCGLQRLPATVTDGQPHGVALNFVLKPLVRAADEADNRAGWTFRIHGTPNSDGLYTIFQDMPIPEIITVDGRQFLFSIRPMRTPLPFAVQLNKFTETLYPGTNKPRAYQSDVIVHDQDIAWPSVIRMNEPLHYKGYTLYQSSFMEGDGTATTTVLAVVKNKGRLFPYIASVILACGFIIHLVQRLVLRRSGRMS